MGTSGLRAEGTNVRFWWEVSTESSREAVWRVWTDVEAWPRWDTELSAAKLDGAMQKGTRGELVAHRGGRSVFEITEHLPGEAYAFTTRLPLASLVVRRAFVDAGGGTRFRHEVWFAGPLGWLFAWLLGSRFRAALPPVMERVKAAAEAAS